MRAVIDFFIRFLNQASQTLLSKCALEIENRNAIRKRIYTVLTVKNYRLFFAFKPSST
jgi:hypothetical protein